jgi:hypothetical protein
MVWNGYQRSETHYKANARPAGITAVINGETGIKLELKDTMGYQVLRFPKTMENVETLAIKVDSVFAGTVYKDMVLSELRLIDGAGKIIILNVALPDVRVADELLAGMLDKTYGPILLGICSDNFPYRRLRIRSNGSFVAYHYGMIMEGNWEPVQGGVRLFGKKYYTDPRASEYLQAVKSKSGVKIFQANVIIIDPAKSPRADIGKYFKAILADRGFYRLIADKNRPKTMDWWLAADKKPTKVSGQTEEELVQKAYGAALKNKAVLLYSSLFTDLFLPADQLRYFSVYDEGE